MADARLGWDRARVAAVRPRARGADSLLLAFLTSTLGAPESALGLIEGFADAAAGAAKFAGGPLADNPQQRRATAVTGYLATAGLSAAIGGATAVWQVAILRTGAWTARGLRVPSRNALLADTVDRSAYGRAYGFERAMDNLGAVGGPLLALALVALVGVRTAIWLSVIPGALAAVAIVYAIRHIDKPKDRTRVPLRFKVRPVLAGGRTWLFAGVSAFELGNVAATLLILRVTEALTGPLGSTEATQVALLLYAGYNLTATVVSLAAGQARTGSALAAHESCSSPARLLPWSRTDSSRCRGGSGHDALNDQRAPSCEQEAGGFGQGEEQGGELDLEGAEAGLGHRPGSP